METLNKPEVDSNLRQKSLKWFFDLSEVEKVELKEKYFPKTYIAYDSKWGFHYTFGQIEEMYSQLNK